MISRKSAVLAILGIALLLRLLALLFYREIPQMQVFVEGGDAIGYTQLACNLLSNGSFRFDHGPPTAFRMPGYPLILTVTYAVWQTPLPTQILQIVVDMLTVLVVYEIGKALSANMTAQLLATMAAALNPLLIVSALALYPETMAIFLISLGTLLLLRFPDSTGAGIAASLVLSTSIYLKPTLLAVVIMSLFLFSVRQLFSRRLNTAKAAASVLPFLVVAILLAPWIVRNLLVMRTFIPLTTSNGVNLLGGNNPESDGGYVFSGHYVLPDMSESDSDREYTRRAVEWIRSNPASFVKLLPFKAARFLWPLSLGTSGYIVVPRTVSVLVLSITLAFYGLAVFGTWQLAVTKRFAEAALLLTPFVCLLLTSLLTFGATRFSLPAFPTLAVLASLGLEELRVTFRHFDDDRRSGGRSKHAAG